MIHYPKYVLQIQKPGWPISCIFVAIWISNEIVLRNMKRNYLRCVALVWACMGMVGRLCAIEADYVTFSPCDGAFCVSASGRSANVYVDENDFSGVKMAAVNVTKDIKRVTKTTGCGMIFKRPVGQGHVVAGTVGKSRWIDSLAAAGRIDVSPIEGKWESYLIQVVDGNLVVAGSDKRGTIYGLYDLSEKIGVSPWYYMADVPVEHHDALYVKPGLYVQEPPKVKYRGIFLNDEWPSLGGWASAKFGGFKADFHRHVFELLLRLRANFFWPAMWSSSFWEDDPNNASLADGMGIIMGTSHHEPMMRPHKDYTKRRREVGPWNYATNKERLDKFFTEGIERSKYYDNVVTIGMRGDGDVAMGGKNATDEDNMRVLADVVKGQREILEKVHGKPASEIPQLWAIFTEVQRYYDKGFTVPDDVLLLFCDNNWGYIRRTGAWKEQRRKGGMGMYYHIDMNGGPWNDRWVNTTTIPKLREQFNLAYRTGIDDLWVVNVGDLKPKEVPIDFIMRYAWDPDAYPAGKEGEYLRGWAAQNFGDAHAQAIADVVARYSKYNLLRKPEVQETNIFSVVNYCEADGMLAKWREVAREADSIGKLLPSEYQDAYYQLVLYPAKASAGVAEIYLSAGKNQLYAKQGRVSANGLADRVDELFKIDREMKDYYNEELADGKWKNMMSDVHLGYVNWAMPRKDSVPPTVRVTPLSKPAMGVAVEGNEKASTGDEVLELPVFDNFCDLSYYIDVFNRGEGSFDFRAKADEPWVKLSQKKGTVEDETRLWVSVDWDKLETGESEASVKVSCGRQRVKVKLRAVKADKPVTDGFFFGNPAGREFSVPAVAYAGKSRGRYAQWIGLPDLGRGEGCMGIDVVNSPSVTDAAEAPCLEYSVYLPEVGKQTVCIGILPTQDVVPERGLRLAYALDEGAAQILDAREGFHDEFREYTPQNLKNSPKLIPLPKRTKRFALYGHGRKRSEVFDNRRWLTAEIDVAEPGLHTFKLYMVDPEVVVEQLVFNPDDAHPSYFGAPAVRHLGKEMK